MLIVDTKLSILLIVWRRILVCKPQTIEFQVLLFRPILNLILQWRKAILMPERISNSQDFRSSVFDATSFQLDIHVFHSINKIDKEIENLVGG